MTLLYLVRHGEAAESAGRAVGHLDLGLSAAGSRDIAALAGSWRGPRPRRIFSSDLRRAADSARLLAAPLGAAVTLDPRLRELSFGEWEGLPWDEIHRRDAARFAAWGERWWEVPPPGGESFAALSERVLAWFSEVMGEATVEEEDALVAVAHGGSLRALLAVLLALPREELFELRLDCARVSAVAVGEAGSDLLFVNRDRFADPAAIG